MEAMSIILLKKKKRIKATTDPAILYLCVLIVIYVMRLHHAVVSDIIKMSMCDGVSQPAGWNRVISFMSSQTYFRLFLTGSFSIFYPQNPWPVYWIWCKLRLRWRRKCPGPIWWWRCDNRNTCRECRGFAEEVRKNLWYLIMCWRNIFSHLWTMSSVMWLEVL